MRKTNKMEEVRNSDRKRRTEKEKDKAIVFKEDNRSRFRNKG